MYKEAPRSISPEAQRVFEEFPKPSELPDLNDQLALRQFRQQFKTETIQFNAQAGCSYEFQTENIAGVRCLWITTPSCRKEAAPLIHLHGGYYIFGDPESCAGYMIRLAELAGVPVLSIDYRLAPEHPFPAALDDVVSVLHALHDRKQPVCNLVLIGESAGGGLALSVAMSLRNNRETLPEALILLSPWTDLTESGDTYLTLASHDPLMGKGSTQAVVKAYSASRDPSEPLISPLFGNFEGLPPILIQAGSREVILSDSIRTARRARTAGVDVQLDIWDGMWHTFHFDQTTPEACEAISEIGDFISRYRSDQNLSHTETVPD